jgi:hypothetical protein
MKKKVLLYGNCQLGVIAKMLSGNSLFTGKYDIILPRDYGLESAWGDGVVSSFLYENRFGENVISSIEECFSLADIIIFQHFKKEDGRPEVVTTECFYSKYGDRKFFLCIPSFWFSGYFTQSYSLAGCFMEIIAFLIHEKRMNRRDIFDWFVNGYFPEIGLLRNVLVKKSMDEMKRRESKEIGLYNNYISIVDILEECDKKLLCYHHSHPSRYFFHRLYERILYYIDGDLLEFNIDERRIECPGANIPFLGDMKFFRESYPNLGNLESDRDQFLEPLNQKYINDQVSILYKLYMKDWIF